ncbi:MAG: methyltransferase [Paracoccaceae bacterium]|nr:methyltransferase [Paracoccaceae bacterium]
MFAADDLTDDGFLGGRLRMLQPKTGYRAATDPVFLAAAVPAKPGQEVLELGCGAGVATLCLAARVAGLHPAGLERQPDYAALARENSARNGLEMTVIEGDLVRMPPELRARSFDHVFANPPYYPASGTPARDPGRAAALREETPLAAWIDAATRRLRPGGWLTMIVGADRLTDLLAGCGSRLGSLSVLPLAPRAGRPAGRVIAQARKGGRAAFRLLAPLVVHEGAAHDGDRDSFTPEAAAILRQGDAIPALWR